MRAWALIAALAASPALAAAPGKARLDPDDLRGQAAAAFKRREWMAAEKAAVQYLEQAPRSAPRARPELLLAEAYFQQRKWPEALAALAKAEKDAPKDSFLAWSAHLRWAETLMRLEKPDKALNALQEVALSPYPLLAAEAKLDSGCLLLRLGREADAQTALQELLQSYPQYRADPQLGKALGFLLLKTGSAPQANDFLKQTIGQADWGDPRHLLLQAMAYKTLGKGQEAIRFFQLVYKYSTEDDWKGEALYQIGEVFLQRKMLSLAAQSFDELLSQYPRAPSRRRALQRLAVMALLNGDAREARAKAEKVLATAPKDAPPDDMLNAQAHYLLGESLIRSKEFSDAKLEFEKAARSPALAMEARLKLMWLSLRLQDSNLAVRQAEDFLRDYTWGGLSGHALLLRGLAYQKAGNLDKASADYVRFLDSYPQHPLEEKVIFLLASAYLQGGKWPELVSHISVAAQKLPVRPTEWQAGIQFCVGEGYYELSRYAEAAALYRTLTRRFPPNRLSPHIYQGLALSYGRMEKYDEAFAAQEKALAFSKTYKNREIVRYGLLTLGDLLFNKRRYKSALAYYDAFLQHFPEDALLPDALYRSASALTRLRREKAAVPLWEKIARQYPNSPYAVQSLLDMGRYFFNAGKYKEAEDTLSRLIASAPQSPEARDALLLLAQNLFNQGLYQEAMSRYEQFAQKYPNDEQAGEIKKLMETSLYHLALEKSSPEAFLNKYPDSAMAEDLFWDLSLKYWNAKDYPKALESLQKLIVHFPDRDKTKRATYMMGEIYFRQKNFKEAAAAYSDYAASKPEDAKLLPRALFREAVSQFQQGLSEEASKTFSSLISAYPDTSFARDAAYNLILADLQAKRPAAAVEACKAYLKRSSADKDNSAVYLQMGHALKELGQTPEAAAAYSKVSPKSASAIEAYYNLGQLYQAQEEYDKARRAYAMLVPLKPKDADLRVSGIAMLAEFNERLGKKALSLRLYKEVAALSKNPEWASAAKQKAAALKAEIRDGGGEK